MADILSAGARPLRLATTPRVDHRKPIHDHFCRCFDCKPPIERCSQARRRAARAFGLLLATFWAVVVYVAFSR